MKVYYFALLFLFAQSLNAQFCKRISLYFDVNKAEITEQSRKTLDSIATKHTSGDFLVEMYGMTDSTGSVKHNSELAQRRMDAVSVYLQPKTKAQFQFRKRNLIESTTRVDGSEEQNLAYNRRVDLYILPLTDGKLIMEGDYNGTAEFSPELFGDCGICNSDPSLKVYQDNEEARAAGITFQTTEGEPLITGGSIILKTVRCQSIANDTAQVTYRICPPVLDPRMTVWEADTIDNKVYWKESSIPMLIDTVTGCYVFTARGGPFFNADVKPGDAVPKEPDTTCRVILPPGFSFASILMADDKGIVRYKANIDSLGFALADTGFVARIFAGNDAGYQFLTAEISTIPFEYRTQKDGNVLRIYKPVISDFKNVFPGDTALVVKHRKATADEYGYYFPAYEVFIPMDSVNGKYSYGSVPAVEYQYAFARKRKVLARDVSAVKRKYLRKENAWRIRIGKKMRTGFKTVRNVAMPPKKK